MTFYRTEKEFKDTIVKALNRDPWFIARESRTQDFSGAEGVYIDIWFKLGDRCQIIECKLDLGMHSFAEALGQCMVYRKLLDIYECDCYIVRPKQYISAATLALQDKIADGAGVRLVWGEEIAAFIDARASRVGLESRVSENGFKYHLPRAKAVV